MEMANVDASSLFLFEATGDSEADLQPILVSIDDHADDDAESCSCDSSGFPGDSELTVCDDEAHVDHGEEEEEVEEEDVDEDEVNSYQSWGGERVKASRNTSKEIMNEMERNRLFWETCLAS